MSLSAPFLRADLDELERFYQRASAVVAMEDVYDGNHDRHVIGLRHDCDNVIHPAVHLAAWEAARGIRSTYYVLHTAPYWHNLSVLRESLEWIAAGGHEIGIHNNALTVALTTGRNPAAILDSATEELRSFGHTIRSTVAHGDQACHIAHYVNDEMFSECPRPSYGEADRELILRGRKVRIQPVSLASFGLEFDANWLERANYLSDSGGHWSQPLQSVSEAFPGPGQLHVLTHPDWWGEALERAEVAA